MPGSGGKTAGYDAGAAPKADAGLLRGGGKAVIWQIGRIRSRSPVAPCQTSGFQACGVATALRRFAPAMDDSATASAA